MQRAIRRMNSLLLSPGRPCSYLPDQTARMIFVDTDPPLQNHVYTQLAKHGFRRNGHYLYRPECEHCNACVPLRIPVDDFLADRSQRRAWTRNQDVHASLRNSDFVDEHYELYRRYVNWRHLCSSTDKPSPEDYAAYLTGNDGSFFVEFRLLSQLVGVAVVDVLEDALSAVYTFYTPDLPQRSLGTFAILWQIAEAKRRRLRWLYLGYWITGSSKMAYKNRFRPFEQLKSTGWATVI
jgi:leucyl-tRNA---protein transferase